LALYWLTTTLLTVLQQLYVFKKEEDKKILSN
jgi:membrane protein insertase Oxa1/YidC/SpoIIIJ